MGLKMNLFEIALLIVGIFYSIIFHEIAHGLAAYISGDPTAKNAKRLSLNPIHHIDPVGTIILPLILYLANMPLFGWAKPVPINPLLFKNKKWGIIFVSLAGIITNFIIMIIMFFLFSIFKMKMFLLLASINFMLFLFNLLPFPPLDGYKFFSEILPFRLKFFITKYESLFLVIFLFLMITGGIRYIYTPLYNFLF